MTDKVEIRIERNELGDRVVIIPDGWAPASPLGNTCTYCAHASHILSACLHGEPDRCMCVFGIPVKRSDREVLGDDQIDAWLRENCRRSGTSWVWPRGTVYSENQSRDIVRVHLALGMGPTEMITVEMISHLLRRIEGLERMFRLLGPTAHQHPREPQHVPPGLPDPNHWSSWTSGSGSSHSGAEGRAMAEAVRAHDACGSCAHILHPGRQCGAQVPTAEGRVCRCMAGVTTAEANAEILKEGMARVRVGAAEDMNDLQTYLEGGTEESQAAARRLDERSVTEGRLSPSAFKAVWGELPPITPDGHRMWCGRKHVDLGLCDFWGGV